MALAVAPGTLLVERRTPAGELDRVRVTVEEGLPLLGRVPVAAAPVLAALDGRRPLADAIASAAAQARVSKEALSAECLPVLRELILRGLLVAARP